MTQRLYSDTADDFHTAEQINNMDALPLQFCNSRLNRVSNLIIKTLCHTLHPRD